MRIDRVDVLNYRTLENVSIQFAGYYTAISGKNNAGKTSLIKVLRETFKDPLMERYAFHEAGERSYRDDKTQWVSGSPDIVFDYHTTIDKESDPGLVQFIEKFLEKSLPGPTITFSIKLRNV